MMLGIGINEYKKKWFQKVNDDKLIEKGFIKRGDTFYKDQDY